MPRMLEAGQSFALRALIAPQPHQDMRVTAVRRHVDQVDLDGQQARIRHLESDELDQLFPHRFRYSEDATFVHNGCRLSVVGCPQEPLPPRKSTAAAKPTDNP